MDAIRLLCFMLIAGCLMAACSGCIAHREKITSIEPTYSYVKEGVQLADQAGPEDVLSTRFARAADHRQETDAAEQ